MKKVNEDTKLTIERLLSPRPAQVAIKLTRKQREQLEPLFFEVINACLSGTQEEDRRGALLGQAWGNGEPRRDGWARFCWLNHEQYEIVAEAINRALALGSKPVASEQRG